MRKYFRAPAHVGGCVLLRRKKPAIYFIAVRVDRQSGNRTLAQLEAAATLEFLRSPPGNRLEALKGDRQGQWRICFRRTAAGPEDVEIVDYHRGSRAYEFQEWYAPGSSG